jgi:hypothetical protein
LPWSSLNPYKVVVDFDPFVYSSSSLGFPTVTKE